MRLKNVERGEALPQRFLFGIIRVASGHRAPDVVRTLMYRKAWFGKPMGELTHAIMRGSSEWTIGERELFAAFVSRINQCPF